MRARLVLAALLLTACTAAQAEDKKQIGNWSVITDLDRFDGSAKIIAVTVQNGAALAVRCMSSSLSLAVGEITLRGNYQPGEMFTVKFRADTNDVIDTVGDALDDKTVEVAVPQSGTLRQLLSAKEFALRVASDASTIDHVFKAGSAKQALASIAKACPETAE